MHADAYERWIARSGRWLGPALFVFCLLLYLWTLSPGLGPGIFAQLVALHSGVDPFLPTTHPLWGRMVRFLLLFSFDKLVGRLAVFSAVCGAGAVWLFYDLLRRVKHNRTAEEVEARVPPEAPQVFSALVGALVLGCSIPFWVASTRAHPAAFDIFVFLLCVWILTRFTIEQRPALMYLFSFLYGLLITEFATAVIWAPVFGLWLLGAMWMAGQLRARPLLGVAVCWVGGLLLYGVAAAEYRLHPAYEWREFASVFQVVWFMWRDQYLAIRQSVPTVGWLLLFVTVFLPGLVVAFPKRAMTRLSVWSSNLLHLLMTLIGLAIVYNAPVAPWPLFGTHAFLIMPYVIVAAWLGYLAGYWMIYFSPHHAFASSRSLHRKIGRRTVVPLVLLLMVAPVVLNRTVADGRKGAALRAFVDSIVEDLRERPWLISNGAFDDMIRVSARARGIPGKVLNLAWGRQSAYLNYTASFFIEPRLRSLSRVGLVALFQEWFKIRPGAERRVAVLAAPDIWTIAGLYAVPDGAVYVGMRDVKALSADEWLERQKKFWREHGARLKAEAEERNPLYSPWAAWAVSHLSRAANNAGVVLEDLGRPRDAFEAYAVALDLVTNNVSALLNSAALAMREGLPEAQELENRLRAVAQDFRRRPSLWSLSQEFGLVRAPETFVRRGMAWALSGRSQAAALEARRAAEMGATPLQLALLNSQLALEEDRPQDSEAAFRSVLATHPNHVGALLGLARLALAQQQWETAQEYLDRAKSAGAPEALTGPVEAMLLTAAGRGHEAKRKLLELTEKGVGSPEIWAMLALSAAAEGDETLLKRSTAVLQQFAAVNPTARIFLAAVALARGDRAGARQQLERIIKADPTSVRALEALIRLSLAEGQRAALADYVDQLLNLDARNPLGNFVLGHLHASRGQLELAEAAFRTSLAGQRSAATLNDLAWVLYLRGKWDEALPLVREALLLNPQLVAAWDTLAAIQLRRGKVADAEEAAQQALRLLPSYLPAVFRMAEIYERRGMRAEALQLAEPLLERAAEMEPELYEGVRKLVFRLKGDKGG